MSKDLLDEYSDAIIKFVNKTGFHYLDTWKKHNRDCAKVDIESFGIVDTLWVCDNSRLKNGSILIMGINPSFNGRKPARYLSFAETSNTNGSDYWQTKKDMVDNPAEVAYLDLFPITMTRQCDFMNDNIIPRELKVELLRITREEIENLHPSVIINPNYGSAVYWGIHHSRPWMGYQMSLNAQNPIGKQTKLYTIEGVQQNDKVICQTQTKLIGTQFLLAKYHGNGALKKDEFLTSDDVEKLKQFHYTLQ